VASADEKLAYGFSTSFLKKNKAVKSLVDKAIKSQWTPDRFIDELKKTSWWKSRSDSQKRFAALSAENPAELRKQISNAWGKVRNMAARLGIPLSTATVRSMATAWVKNGLDEDQMRDMIGKRYRIGSKGTAEQRGTVGIAGAARFALDEMSREYGMTWSRSFLQSAASKVARGRAQVSDFESYAREQASLRFKAIANDIKEGRTVREIIDPYIQVASEELGLPASIFDTNNVKWLKPVSGDHQFSMDEWVKTIRSDKSYGYDQSQNASRQASVFATQLMSRMGAM
jgi:hypothetical protein